MITLLVCLIMVGVSGILLVPAVVSFVIKKLSADKLLGGQQSSEQTELRTKVVSTFLQGMAFGVKGRFSEDIDQASACFDFERPFWLEGLCAGLFLSRLWAPWKAHRSLDLLWQSHHDYHFLLTIGLGFAAGMRPRRKQEGVPIPDRRVEPKLKTLYFNGYAFQQVVFKYLQQPSILHLASSWGAAERYGFYEGAGRALWFLVPDYHQFHSIIGSLPANDAEACMIGYGIASGFAGCQSTGSRWAFANSVPVYADHLRTGVIVGLFARMYTNPTYLSGLLEQTAGPQLLQTVREARALYEHLWSRGASYDEWLRELHAFLRSRSSSTCEAVQSELSMTGVRHA